MGATDAVFYIAILVMSVVIHEVSHGFMAEKFGDLTARHAGRLTLNPLKHLDLFGSVILPALLILSKVGFLFGWAKPVPYNPDNLRDRKWGTIAVASAGILANFFIAFIFGMVLRYSAGYNPSESFKDIISIIVEVNIALGVFNLVPLPPLDGSKILFNLLPKSFYAIEELLERYHIIFLLLFISFFTSYLSPIINYIYQLFTGLSF